MLQRPSRFIRLIRHLPARNLLLRVWNRVVRFRREFIVETVFGATMRANPVDIIQATILHFGVWEPEMTAILQQLIRPGDLTVDIGANVGYYSLLFSSLHANVIAIEPHPRLAAKVIENDRLNSFNIVVKEVAVARAEGSVTLYEAPQTNTGMTTTMPGVFAKSFKVAAAPLLKILDGVDLKRISLIKIDIEGAEAPLMREIAHNLHMFGDRLVICVEAGSDWQDAFDLLQRAGFKAYRVTNELSTLWKRLLLDHPADSPQIVCSLPSDRCDLLLTRSDEPIS